MSLKDATKTGNRCQSQHQNFLTAQNLQNLSEIIQFLLSHSPRYRDVQVIFPKVLLKFKMAATNGIYNYLWAETYLMAG